MQNSAKAKISVALMSFLFSATAFAHPQQYIVVDAETNKVLEEQNADLPDYPASLTKMMTLYLLFEELESNRITLDTEFVTSRRAASQPPSKISLRPGEKIAVHDLIPALVAKSANDAAVVVAEGLAGSEKAFAERMTAKAEALGMEHTVYYNASGLPNLKQKTTPRDLVKLALALQHNFPKEYAYFAVTEFEYKSVRYETHNHLMETFKGMDGIKTGFIDASGFNLVASAVRDGRRLVGVIMGGQSAYERDKEMTQLLDAAFAGEVYASNRKPPLRRTLHRLSPVREANVTGYGDAKHKHDTVHHKHREHK